MTTLFRLNTGSYLLIHIKNHKLFIIMNLRLGYYHHVIVICKKVKKHSTVLTWNLVFCRMRKDRHDGGAPSGFSRFPAAEGDSDEEEEYEKERRKRSEYFSILA